MEGRQVARAAGFFLFSSSSSSSSPFPSQDAKPAAFRSSPKAFERAQDVYMFIVLRGIVMVSPPWGPGWLVVRVFLPTHMVVSVPWPGLRERTMQAKHAILWEAWRGGLQGREESECARDCYDMR